MRKRIWFLFSLVSVICHALAIENQDIKQHSFTQQVATAVPMGIIGAIVGTPLRYWATMEQRGMSCSSDPRVWFRGTPMNALRAFPSLTAQIIIMETGKSQLHNDQSFDKEKFARATAASIASTVISTPTENIIIQRQSNNNQSCFQVAQKIHKDHGFRHGIYRGFAPKLWRDLPGGLGYWYIAPAIKKTISPYIQDDKGATIVAGSLVGGACAAATNSIDAISTKMQADLPQQKLKHFTQAACELKSPGLFYKGLLPRTLAGILGFPIARLTQDLATSIFDKIKRLAL